MLCELAVVCVEDVGFRDVDVLEGRTSAAPGASTADVDPQKSSAKANGTRMQRIDKMNEFIFVLSILVHLGFEILVSDRCQ